MKTTANTAMKAPAYRVLVTALRMSLLLCLLGLTFESSAQSRVIREMHVEDDGFVWYEVTEDSGLVNSYWKTGAESSTGRILVPRKFQFIYYDTKYGGYFTSRNIDSRNEACYDKDGTCIIPIERGYTSIRRTEDDGILFYYVSKGDYNGACDARGREIIAPQYKELIYGVEIFWKDERTVLSQRTFQYKNSAGEWISLNISADGRRITPNNTDNYAGSSSSSSNTEPDNITESFLAKSGKYDIFIELNLGEKTEYKRGEASITIENKMLTIKGIDKRYDIPYEQKYEIGESDTIYVGKEKKETLAYRVYDVKRNHSYVYNHVVVLQGKKIGLSLYVHDIPFFNYLLY